MHLPAAMDGGPHQVIENGETWSPRFTIRQQAATLWYHPHLLGATEEQVGRGLVGLFILDDDNPGRDRLPHTYGIDDLPLILQDIGADGRFNVGFRRRGPCTTWEARFTFAWATVELWNIVNRSGATHMFHIHDVEFQIVDRSSGPLAANELGRKDTVIVRSGETARVIMQFADFADPHAPYMFHCHVLGHEDQGMMGQFVVV